jgi:hypothetical protein
VQIGTIERERGAEGARQSLGGFRLGAAARFMTAANVTRALESAEERFSDGRQPSQFFQVENDKAASGLPW